MRWARCELDELYVAGTLGGGRLTRGSRIDLDAEVAPKVTYAQALGDYVQHFTLETPVAAPLEGLPADDEAVSEDTAPATEKPSRRRARRNNEDA